MVFEATYLVAVFTSGQKSLCCGQNFAHMSKVFRPSNKSAGMFICFLMAVPLTSSECGLIHPPYAKPPLVSSSGPPGACMTPSRETNSSTLTFLMTEFLSSPICLCRSSQNRGISLFFSSKRIERTGNRALRQLVHLVTRARIPRPQWPGWLLPFAGFLFRSRVEKKLAHLAGHIAGDGTLLRPCQRLVDISAFQYPKSAHVLLGLGVRPVGDEHLAVGLGPQRLCAASRGNAAGELPHAGSNQFAVESVDL